MRRYWHRFQAWLLGWETGTITTAYPVRQHLWVGCWLEINWGLRVQIFRIESDGHAQLCTLHVRWPRTLKEVMFHRR